MSTSDSKHFKPRRRAEADYAQELLQVIFDDILPEWFKAPMSSMPSIDFDLTDVANRIARKMVTGVSYQNAKSWRAAAAQSSEGRRIYRLLSNELNGHVGAEIARLVEHNARLIRSLPSELAKEITASIEAARRSGERSGEIAADLRRKLPHISRSKAALIARTEVAKAETAMTQARSEALDIRWYQWTTSNDSRVRASHKLMKGVLVAFSDAPAPEQLDGIRSTLGHYNAGQCPNCRCIALPLIRLNRVSWPARVYTGGRILERVSMAEFKRIAGIVDQVPMPDRRVAA